MSGAGAHHDEIDRLCREAASGTLGRSLLETVLGPAEALAEGRVAVWKGRGVVAVTAGSQPNLVVDDGQARPLIKLPRSPYWYRGLRVTAGATHRVRLLVGDDLLTDTDVAGYGRLSHSLPAAAEGRLLGPFSVRSRIYAGATIRYWLRLSAGVASDTPSPFMVWFDGSYFTGTSDLLGYRLGIVSDNLVHLGRMPPMVHVLIDPAPGRRSEQYDAVSPRLGEHVFGEVIADAEKRVRLRRDGYSVGAGGESSGAAAAFGLGWFHNGAITRVHSGIGSFTGLEGASGTEPRGAFLYAHLVRREHPNLRVWMSAGARDLNAGGDGSSFAIAGSWPLANITLADSLGRSGYDVAFRFGTAGHNSAQGALDLPESLSWLWRDYDPHSTSADFSGPGTGLEVQVSHGLTT